MKRKKQRLQLRRRAIRQLTDLEKITGGARYTCASYNHASMSSEPTLHCNSFIC